ncbi:MAG: hypothetical protein M1434_12490 [Chloroflexi bacterium]|nr:hypothetical protein [Chloroflexota bacterium]MCL5275542.1 hypothetical protein [Chloroflexota bacterium]
MTHTLRRILTVIGVGLTCVALLSACNRSSGNASGGAAEVRFYPTDTAVAVATAATSAPSQPALTLTPTPGQLAPASQQQTATATTAASTGDPAGDKVEQLLQKLDDSLNKTDTMQDAP